MKLQLTPSKITLSVGNIHRPLTRAQVITLMGFGGHLYHNEASLFCSAWTVISKLDNQTALEFLAYTDADWDNMIDYVAELYENAENLVDCRNN